MRNSSQDVPRRPLSPGSGTALLSALAIIAFLVLAVGANAASITSVKLKAKPSTTKSPTVTVQGTEFGAKPTAFSAAETTCGAYGPKNGAWFGTQPENHLWFSDKNNVEPFEWVAGVGTETGNGSCVGIVLKQWTPTKVVFKFGVAYGSFSDWTVFKGDEYTLAVAGATFTGHAT